MAFSITYIGSLFLLAMSMVEVGLCSVSGGMSSLFFLNDVPCSKGRTNWRESDMTSGAFSVIRLVFELHAHKLAMMKGSDSCYFRKHVSTKHLEIRSGLTVRFI